VYDNTETDTVSLYHDSSNLKPGGSYEFQVQTNSKITGNRCDKEVLMLYRGFSFYQRFLQRRSLCLADKKGVYHDKMVDGEQCHDARYLKDFSGLSAAHHGEALVEKSQWYLDAEKSCK
jgi:hypothetical protein